MESPICPKVYFHRSAALDGHRSPWAAVTVQARTTRHGTDFSSLRSPLHSKSTAVVSELQKVGNGRWEISILSTAASKPTSLRNIGAFENPVERGGGQNCNSRAGIRTCTCEALGNAHPPPNLPELCTGIAARDTNHRQRRERGDGAQKKFQAVRKCTTP